MMHWLCFLFFFFADEHEQEDELGWGKMEGEMDGWMDISLREAGVDSGYCCELGGREKEGGIYVFVL